METYSKVTILALTVFSLSVSAQKVINLEGVNDPNFVNKNGKIGIGTLHPEGNLQIGSGTQNGLITLGGGKGYSSIGSTRSDSGLVLGKNIYASYDNDEKDNGFARVGKTDTYGFSGIKLGNNGQIDFFGKNGYVTSNQIANSDQNIKLRINSYGKVGIGTLNPEGNLQIGSGTQNGLITLGGGKGYSSVGSTRSDGGLIFGKNIYTRYLNEDDNKIARVGKTTTKGFSGIKLGDNGQIDFFGKNGHVTSNQIANSDQNTKLRISENGNVGIGTVNPGAWRLAVNGKVRAKEIKVETGWADFVFYKDYKLPTLTEVENHIKAKGHLKDIPSAKEVAENGIFLGEMNAKLLQKIEELTLYTIAQEKKLTSQAKKIELLEKENDKIKSLEKQNILLKSINSELLKIKNRLEKLENK